jgi:hypothetical protein
MIFFIFHLLNFRPKKLPPAGAGYGFGQNSMNFVKKATGLHALRKQRSVVTIQAGTLYKGADLKIELIVYFLGHWFHYICHNHCSGHVQTAQIPKKAVSYHRSKL